VYSLFSLKRNRFIKMKTEKKIRKERKDEYLEELQLVAYFIRKESKNKNKKETDRQ
jgi:hypothetical protein